MSLDTLPEVVQFYVDARRVNAAIRRGELTDTVAQEALESLASRLGMTLDELIAEAESSPATILPTTKHHEPDGPWTAAHKMGYGMLIQHLDAAGLDWLTAADEALTAAWGEPRSPDELVRRLWAAGPPPSVARVLPDPRTMDGAKVTGL
jgi:hypothetical protein